MRPLGIRHGSYRVLYWIDDTHHTVIIATVRHLDTRSLFTDHETPLPPRPAP
ncbi:MAG: hypothetical protein M3Z25_10465 [Actinomycetota bacterium]|nr:hypothetical protein [Actinomycetota bacterium]